MAINDFINKLTNKFTDTVFFKEDSELELQIEALKKLKEKYPDNYVISQKLLLAELGYRGEKEIEFELKNANIGMYVLHDVNIEYQDLKAQIDYLVITPAKKYFIECKNLVGNITIDNKGNFVREYQYGKRKIKEGIYSPINQAQRHVEIYKKIWKERNTGLLDKTIRLKHFDEFNVPLVVLANSKNVLNDRYAPKDVKKYVIRSDRLVDYLKKDLEATDKDYLWGKKDMYDFCYNFMINYNKIINKNYEKELEEWVKNNSKCSKTAERKEENQIDNTAKVLEVRKKLIDFRASRAKEKNIPPYYVFNNDELDKILILMPKTKQELVNAKILTEVKLKLHGDEIVRIINE